MLVFTTTEFESDPSGRHQYVSLSLEVDEAPFSGASSCTVRGYDLATFLDELVLLARTGIGSASLMGGWGEREYVSLKANSHGKLGHLALRVMIREYQPKSDFRVEGTIIIEPQTAIDWAASVESALNGQELKRIELKS